MFLRTVRRHHFLAIVILVSAGIAGWIAVETLLNSTNERSITVSDARVSGSFTRPDKATRSTINETYGRLPLSFEANRGQADSRIDFISRGNGYSLFLSPTETLLQVRNNEKNEKAETALLRMEIVGSNPGSKAMGLDELPGKSNYLIGGEQQSWATNIATYSKVQYPNVYPGIDLVYYGNQRRLEYDFLVRPGSSHETIRLRFDEVPLEIDEGGDLVLSFPGGTLIQKSPVVYQELDGEKQLIASRYVLKGEREVGFEVAPYDSSRTLIIDPVLTYSTFLGGVGADEGSDIAIDSNGNSYIVGTTMSTNFPIVGGFQNSNAGGADAFVLKLNSTGSAIIYSTFIGGSMEDFGSGIAIDSTGNAYITGDTTSTNFPTVGPFQAASGGRQDAFVAKLNPTGSGLIYSTYLGGAAGDSGVGIAIDSSGSAYVAGITNSTNLPIANAAQAINGGAFDAFVSKLNPAGSALVYSTYLGGNGSDFGTAVALDSAGNAYVTGSTSSPNFPIAVPFQSTFRGGNPFGDAFVTKLTTTGSFSYSTFLGGSESEFGSAIAVDSSGNAYITGGTLSPNFPTVNALKSTFGGGRDFGDVFVTKLNAAGNMPVYSTYLGDSGDEFGSGIAIDAAGNAYLTGSTSSNFPVVDPLSNQNAFAGGISDAFVMKLSASGGSIIYSTYLGGGIEDRGAGIAIDALGSAYITGNTNSSNFPTARPLQAGNSGKDTFVAKIADSSAPVADFTLTINPATQTVTAGSSTSFTIAVQPQNGFAQSVNLSAVVAPANGNVTATFSPSTVNPGGNATLTVNTAAATTPGNFAITITGTSGQLVRTQTANITVNAPPPTPDFAIVFNPSTVTVRRKQSGQLTATINRVGGFTGNVTITAPNTKPLKITLTPATQSTTGTSASFNFKVKKKAPRGSQQLTFTARDDSGRVRTGTLTLVVQ